MTSVETRELIEQAFRDVAYPGDDNIADHQDCLECEDVRAFFRGKSWRDLRFPELHAFQGSLPLLTPAAFRFFLPGYMLAALEAWDQVDMLPYSIMQIGGYRDDAWNVKDECRENRKIFDLGQRQAIAAWLRELYAFDPNFWEDQAAFEYTVKCIVDD